MAVGKILTVIILAAITINVMVYLLPVVFNSTATTSFTVWGTDYLWMIGIFALIVTFGALLAYWNDIKGMIGV